MMTQLQIAGKYGIQQGTDDFSSFRARAGLNIGTGSGFVVISNGAECLLIGTDKMDRLFERSFEASIRKIRLGHFTPRPMFVCLRIRL